MTPAASAPPGPPAPAPRAETSHSLASTVRLPAPDATDALSSIEAIAAGFDDERVSTFATIGLPPPAEDRRRAHLPRFSTRPPSASGSGSVEFGDVLGRGGMGVVLTATQRSLDREIAVKRVHDDADHLEAGNRLVVEALLTGALQHPNIVPVYELGTDEDGAPLMLMKRIEGRPWHQDLQHAPKPGSAGWGDWIEAQLRVLIAVCDALRYAHARGILHRDLKPENVMLGAFGEVLVVDWGVAVARRRDWRTSEAPRHPTPRLNQACQRFHPRSTTTSRPSPTPPTPQKPRKPALNAQVSSAEPKGASAARS